MEGERRLREVVKYLGVARSSWYGGLKPKARRKRPGPTAKPMPPELATRIVEAAHTYPWWGYKRVAVVLQRQGFKVSTKQVWRVYQAEGLLHKWRRARPAELYQALKLYKFLGDEYSGVRRAAVWALGWIGRCAFYFESQGVSHCGGHSGRMIEKHDLP